LENTTPDRIYEIGDKNYQENIFDFLMNTIFALMSNSFSELKNR